MEGQGVCIHDESQPVHCTRACITAKLLPNAPRLSAASEFALGRTYDQRAMLRVHGKVSYVYVTGGTEYASWLPVQSTVAVEQHSDPFKVGEQVLYSGTARGSEVGGREQK